MVSQTFLTLNVQFKLAFFDCVRRSNSHCLFSLQHVKKTTKLTFSS